MKQFASITRTIVKDITPTKGITMFNENKLTGNQVAILFGATCFAASAATGLVLRALTKSNKKFHGTNENLRDEI